MQAQPVAILLPLAVGAIAVLCTIFIHALAVAGTVNFIRREKRLGREGLGLWTNLAIVALAMSFVLVAHLVEMNHSPRFWRLLQEMEPEQATLRVELRRAAPLVPAAPHDRGTWRRDPVGASPAPPRASAPRPPTPLNARPCRAASSSSRRTRRRC